MIRTSQISYSALLRQIFSAIKGHTSPQQTEPSSMLASSPDMDTVVVGSTHPLEAGASLSLNHRDQATINLFETVVGEIPDTLQLSFTTVLALRRKLRTIIQGPHGQNWMTTYVFVLGVLTGGNN